MVVNYIRIQWDDKIILIKRFSLYIHFNWRKQFQQIKLDNSDEPATRNNSQLVGYFI